MQVNKESIATGTEEILLKGTCKLHRSFFIVKYQTQSFLWLYNVNIRWFFRDNEGSSVSSWFINFIVDSVAKQLYVLNII